MNYRNRKLLDLAHEIPCQLQIENVCSGSMAEAAHSNLGQHGKGKSMKAHDCFFAAACRECHFEIDNGKRLSKDERENIWRAGHERTMLLLWRIGYLQVAR